MIQKLVKTKYGTFKVKYNNDSISLGGSTNCITISSKGNIAWFETEKGGCEINCIVHSILLIYFLFLQM